MYIFIYKFFVTTEKYEKYIQKCIDKHIKAIVPPHLIWNTNIGIFDQIRELSGLP